MSEEEREEYGPEEGSNAELSALMGGQGKREEQRVKKKSTENICNCCKCNNCSLEHSHWTHD